MFFPLLIAAVLGASSGADAVPLKVMSFNIRHGLAEDGPNAWDFRKDMLIDTMRMYDADVVGLQECLDFQAEYIAEKLPDYAWFGMGRDRNGGDEHTAIFYRKALLAPIETGNYWLSDTPDVVGSRSWDSSLPRIATWGTFWHRDRHFAFHLTNVHFDHRGELARAFSAEIIAERTAALPAEMPVIVTGDFNSRAETTVPWTNATAKGLKDAWPAAKERAGALYTSNGFRPLDETKEGRIDWILVRGPIEVLKCETVTYNVDGRFPSDHFPIYAELLITPPVKED